MASPAEVVAEERSRAEALADTFISELQQAFQTLLADQVSEPVVNVEFGAVEEPALLDTNLLRTRLEARLDGGTGLAAAVETAIWDRAREREAATAQAQVDEATMQDEALGFDFPTGALQSRLEAVGQEYHGKVSSLSRDIAIKQADLEQQNLRDAMQGLVQLYQMLATQSAEHWRALISQNESTRNFALSAAKINSDILNANRSTRLDAAKVQAQVLAQLCAAAIGRVNISAGVSGSTSSSWSQSLQGQFSAAQVSSVAPIAPL